MGNMMNPGALAGAAGARESVHAGGVNDPENTAPTAEAQHAPQTLRAARLRLRLAANALDTAALSFLHGGSPGAVASLVAADPLALHALALVDGGRDV